MCHVCRGGGGGAEANEYSAVCVVIQNNVLSRKDGGV